jgi:hypothetical protein
MPNKITPHAGPWRSCIGKGGWATLEQDKQAGGERVLVRLEPDADGRLRIRELHLLDTGEPVTAERLRAVRVSGLETILNLPAERAAIDAALKRAKTPDLEAAAGPFKPLVAEAERTYYLGDHLRYKHGYPPEWYEGVAAVYRRELNSDRRARPIAAIAAEAGVPRSTAARWVKEARRRGLIGGTKQGRAGDSGAS